MKGLHQDISRKAKSIFSILLVFSKMILVQALYVKRGIYNDNSQ